MRQIVRLGISSSWIVMALLLGGAALAAESSPPVKVDGYVDAQLFGSSRASLSDGFVAFSGSVFVSKDFNGTEAKIGIPFMPANNSPTDAAFTLGAGKFRAYVAHKYPFGLKWKLGQFDTFLGFELNDAPDIAFTRHGLVYSAAIPVVHTGLVTSYDLMQNMTINLMVANPRDQNKLRQANPEFAAQLTFNPANFRFAAGYLFGKDATTTETGSVLDVVAGATFGPLAADAEMTMKKFAAVGVDSGMGLLGNLIYSVTDEFSAGARVEYASKLGTATLENGYTTVGDNQLMITAGPQYSITKELKAKLDYTYLKDTPAAGDATTEHFYALAAVYKF